MAKFKVLKNSQKYLDYVGISLDRSINPTSKNIFKLLTGYYVLIVSAIGLVISAAFIRKYPSKVKPALGALKICIGVSQCMGMFLSIKMKTITIKALQNEFQQIVDAGISIFATSFFFFLS